MYINIGNTIAQYLDEFLKLYLQNMKLDHLVRDLPDSKIF